MLWEDAFKQGFTALAAAMPFYFVGGIIIGGGLWILPDDGGFLFSALGFAVIMLGGIIMLGGLIAALTKSVGDSVLESISSRTSSFDAD